MKIANKTSTCLLVLVGQFFLVSGSWAGPPSATFLKVLPAESWAEQEMYQYADIEPVWVNWEALRKKGFDIPPEGMTPAFKAKLKHLFASGIPTRGDKNGLFDRTIKKVGFADRYGGKGAGTGGNDGSARSTVIEVTNDRGDDILVQNKANGLTTLAEVGVWGGDHYTGKGPFEEMTHEIWGVVFHRETPAGGNQPLIIWATHENVDGVKGLRLPGGFETRHFDPRLAHFGPISSGMDENGHILSTEIARLKFLAREYLPQSLPHLPDAHFQDLGEEAADGLINYARLLGEQHGRLWALRLHPGTSTTSNIQANASGVDWANATALPTWLRAMTYVDNAAFDDIEKFRYHQLTTALSNLEPFMPTEWMMKLPTSTRLISEFRTAFIRSQRKNTLLLTGIPEKLAASLEDIEVAPKLADLLIEMARAGNEKEVWVNVRMPRKLERTYDLPKILILLAEAPGVDPKTLDKSIIQEVVNSEMRGRLVQAYSDYMTNVYNKASADGIKQHALHTLISQGARIQAPPISVLYKPSFTVRNYFQIAKAFLTRNFAKYQAFVDGILTDARRSYPDVGPYEVVIREDSDATRGTLLRRIYNAAEGRYEILVRVQKSASYTTFYNHAIPMDQVSKLYLHYVDVPGTTENRVAAVDKGDAIEFRLPLRNESRAIQFDLRTADGATRWDTTAKGWWRAAGAGMTYRLPTPSQSATMDDCYRILLGK